MEPKPDYFEIYQLTKRYDDILDKKLQAALFVEAISNNGSNNGSNNNDFFDIDITIWMLFAELNGNLLFANPPISASGVCSYFHIGFNYNPQGSNFWRYFPRFPLDTSSRHNGEIKLPSPLFESGLSVFGIAYLDRLGYFDDIETEPNGSSVSIGDIIRVLSNQLFPPILCAIIQTGVTTRLSTSYARKITRHRELYVLLAKSFFDVIESVRNPQPTPDQNQYEDQYQDQDEDEDQNQG